MGPAVSRSGSARPRIANLSAPRVTSAVKRPALDTVVTECKVEGHESGLRRRFVRERHGGEIGLRLGTQMAMIHRRSSPQGGPVCVMLWSRSRDPWGASGAVNQGAIPMNHTQRCPDHRIHPLTLHPHIVQTLLRF